ncbi:unnamed protein product, partial [marine sediment metagenome]
VCRYLRGEVERLEGQAKAMREFNAPLIRAWEGMDEYDE